MPQVTVDQAIQLALDHHRAGRLQEAENIYSQITANVPNHADALHLRGVLAGQVRRYDLALDFIRRAIEINPNAAEFHQNLGIILSEAGKLDDAIPHLRRAIELKPDSPAPIPALPSL